MAQPRRADGAAVAHRDAVLCIASDLLIRIADEELGIFHHVYKALRAWRVGQATGHEARDELLLLFSRRADARTELLRFFDYAEASVSALLSCMEGSV